MVPSSIVTLVPMVRHLIRVKYQRQKKCLDRVGNKKITVQNLEIVRVDAENNLLLVKGSVPGPKKCLVTIKETVKGN